MVNFIFFIVSMCCAVVLNKVILKNVTTNIRKKINLVAWVKRYSYYSKHEFVLTDHEHQNIPLEYMCFQALNPLNYTSK